MLKKGNLVAHTGPKLGLAARQVAEAKRGQFGKGFTGSGGQEEEEKKQE